MKIEIKTAITEITVPVKVCIGSNYRIHPCYAYLGIESKNVVIVELVYFKNLNIILRTEVIEDFGIEEDDTGFNDEDIMVIYKDKAGELKCMELEFFISHSSSCS